MEKKILKSITHVKVETPGHRKNLTITLLSLSYEYLQHSIACTSSALQAPALCFATCIDLSYAAILPSKLICFCRTKTFLLHLSKHTTTGEHSHSFCLWLISRLELLVLNKGCFLQSRCILSLTEKFCSKCGHFTSNFTNLLLEKKKKNIHSLLSKTRILPSLTFMLFHLFTGSKY